MSANLWLLMSNQRLIALIAALNCLMENLCHFVRAYKFVSILVFREVLKLVNYSNS